MSERDQILGAFIFNLKSISESNALKKNEDRDGEDTGWQSLASTCTSMHKLASFSSLLLPNPSLLSLHT